MTPSSGSAGAPEEAQDSRWPMYLFQTLLCNQCQSQKWHLFADSLCALSAFTFLGYLYSPSLLRSFPFRLPLM